MSLLIEGLFSRYLTTPRIPRDRTKLRKRDHKDLRTLDPNSPEYWEEILRREGLSMSRGLSRKLSYRGTSSDLAVIAERNK